MNSNHPKLSNDYFAVTKIISLLTHRSNKLAKRAIVTVLVLSLMAAIIIITLDEIYGMELRGKPTFLLIVLLFILCPIIIDLIEYQIDRFIVNFRKILQRNGTYGDPRFEKIVQTHLRNPKQFNVGTIILAIPLFFMTYWLIPFALYDPSKALSQEMHVILTAISIFPIIVISNIIILSYCIVTALPEICKCRISISPFFTHKMKDLGGLGTFVISTIFLVSSVSLIIPHAVYQISTRQISSILLPLGVMLLILFWIVGIVIVSLFHIHRLVLITKEAMLDKQASLVQKLHLQLRKRLTLFNGTNIELLDKNLLYENQLYDKILNTPEWPFDRDAIIGIFSSIILPILTLTISVVLKTEIS
jgi:hypothetical protein